MATSPSPSENLSSSLDTLLQDHAARRRQLADLLAKMQIPAGSVERYIEKAKGNSIVQSVPQFAGLVASVNG